MIIEEEIISQPYSGEYTERIYETKSAWNSRSWTFVKFTNGVYSKWCGPFRGFPRQVAILTPKSVILVLTSDYLYALDIEKGKLTI